MGENMNRKVSVELDWDAVDSITVFSMKSTLENLEIRLQERNDDSGMAVFVAEKEFDVLLLEKHIEALNLLLKYYGKNVSEQSIC
jgi:hypothetical protein